MRHRDTQPTDYTLLKVTVGQRSYTARAYPDKRDGWWAIVTEAPGVMATAHDFDDLYDKLGLAVQGAHTN